MGNYKITIPGKFPSLNEFIEANRVRKGSWSKGNDMKQKDQEYIIPFIRREIKRELKPPVYLSYKFFCLNQKKDKDNIASYFLKVFQDSLVKSGVLYDDGWYWIDGFEVAFDVDKGNPRIEVEIREIGE